VTPSIPSLATLRDLTLKVELDDALQRDVKAFLERAPAPETSEQRAYLEDAGALAGRCLSFLDGEMARLTEQRFSAPDPNALRQRLLGEPRRQVDGVLNGIRQKISTDKQDWARRIGKQMADVGASIEQQVESLELAQQAGKHEVTVTPDAEWARAFDAWKADTFSRWAAHLAPLVQAKTYQLLEADLQTLRELLGAPVGVELHKPAAMALPAGREQQRALAERFEVPTTLEAFFETFKGGLSTVAMIAGMVIVPVIGSLMHTASTEVRALVMGGMVTPIGISAFFQARAQRRKITAQNLDRARDRLQKAIVAEAKLDLERFKPDAERYATQYGATAQAAVLAAADRLIAEAFDRREKDVARDLARAQLQTDRVTDQLNLLRQIKGSLSGTLVVDLKRRVQDLEAQRG
jgi:cell pole-organizing protein PopZ